MQKRKVINNRRRSLVKNTKEKEEEKQRWWKMQPFKSKGETRTWKARQKVVAEKETRREEFWKATLIVSARCLAIITDYQGLSRIVKDYYQRSSRIIKDCQGSSRIVSASCPHPALHRIIKDESRERTSRAHIRPSISFWARKKEDFKLTWRYRCCG